RREFGPPKVKVLVVGSGAREHALVWKCVQSDLVERVYCAPGNGGTGGMGRNVPIGAADVVRLVDFAKREKLGLVVLGPEAAVDGETERPRAAMLVEERFGKSGKKIVVEERLEGAELSLLAVTDGTDVVALAPARHYKRALDGDRGDNTGGMGAYSPPQGVDD